MKNLLLALTVLLSLVAKSQEFVDSKTLPEKTPCSFSKNVLTFSDLKQTYKLYEKNISATQVVKCEKVKINDLTFYSVLYVTAIADLGADKKAMIYEVASINNAKKILTTVRSEVVDELDQSGDSTATQFQNSLKVQWGSSSIDKSVLLRLTVFSANEKPFSYLLKYNPKSVWFENKF